MNCAHPFKNAGDSEHSGRGHFCVAVLDGLDQVLGSVVQTLAHITEALSVGSPQHDDLQ